MPRLAVIDTETTGLGPNDRVVEIAVVILDPDTLETVDEYDTLINPMRDIGPLHIHQISASMVAAAPTFDEIAGDLAERLHGHILVAHNLPFDIRMVRGEYQRLGGDLIEGHGIDTLKLSGSRLDVAARAHRITLDDHHRALADARVAADLLRALCGDVAGELEAATVVGDLRSSFHTLRRDVFDREGAAVLARVVADERLRAGTFDRAYLETLDWMLDDFTLDAEERAALARLAELGGADAATIATLHERYYEAFLRASRRDGIVSDLEHAILFRLADLLEVPTARVPAPTVLPSVDAIAPGMVVCFSGTAIDADGAEWPRGELEDLAREHGLEPVGTVTGSCDAVVASDALLASRKVATARDLGIPVVSLAEFLELLDAG